MGIGAGTSIDMGHDIYHDINDNFWSMANWNMSKEQIKEQKYLNRNKYQISVADMRAAGINPLLAIGGAGSGMQSTVSTPSQKSSPGHSLAMGQSSARQAKVAEDAQGTARALADSQIDLNDSAAKLNDEKVITEIANQTEATARARLTDTNAEVMRQQINANLPSAQQAKIKQETLTQEYENYRAEAQKGMYKGKKGKVMSWVEWVSKLILR